MLFNGVSAKYKQFIKEPKTYNSNQYILYKSHVTTCPKNKFI